MRFLRELHVAYYEDGAGDGFDVRDVDEEDSIEDVTGRARGSGAGTRRRRVFSQANDVSDADPRLECIEVPSQFASERAIQASFGRVSDDKLETALNSEAVRKT